MRSLRQKSEALNRIVRGVRDARARDSACVASTGERLSARVRTKLFGALRNHRLAAGGFAFPRGAVLEYARFRRRRSGTLDFAQRGGVAVCLSRWRCQIPRATRVLVRRRTSARFAPAVYSRLERNICVGFGHHLVRARRGGGAQPRRHSHRRARSSGWSSGRHAQAARGCLFGVLRSPGRIHAAGARHGASANGRVHAVTTALHAHRHPSGNHRSAAQGIYPRLATHADQPSSVEDGPKDLGRFPPMPQARGAAVVPAHGRAPRSRLRRRLAEIPRAQGQFVSIRRQVVRPESDRRRVKRALVVL